MASAPAATCAATASPVTVSVDVAPAPTVSYTTPVPVIEHMPALVIEYIAPPPAESFLSFSLPNEAITGLVNPQISISTDETSQVQVVVQATPEIPVAEWIQEHSVVTDLVNPQFSITAAEASQVVGLFPLLELQQHSRMLLFRKFLSFQLWSGFNNRMLLFRKFLSFQLWGGFKNKLWRPSKWPHKSA